MSQEGATAHRPTPRVCVCVLMNHPFSANLPLLRRIYGNRFSELRFLIPFERLPDPDVITVYRGSYNHASYLADAHAALSQIDCDYYMMIHDDVLLNPLIEERNFFDWFKLGPDDGFISRVANLPERYGRWIWYSAFLPKLLYPKSLLFGTGVEFANLVKYLPSADRLATSMALSGVTPTTEVTLDAEAMEDISRIPSRVLLHGLAAALPANEAQAAVDAQSLTVHQLLTKTMLAAQTLASTTAGSEQPANGMTISLPFPVVHAGYGTDFYILPRSGLDEFCHLIGVAGAANLFVEIIAPTLLFAACARVRTADELGLDFDGFDHSKPLSWFEQADAVAIHPIKLSAFLGAERQDAFIELLHHVGTGDPVPAAAWSKIGSGLPVDIAAGDGWHTKEGWGRWACLPEATAQLVLSAPSPVELLLRAPTHPALPPMTGRLRCKGSDDIFFSIAWPQVDLTVKISQLQPDADGVGRVTIVTDRMVNPVEIDPTASDHRQLGFGLLTIRPDGAPDIKAQNAPSTSAIAS